MASSSSSSTIITFQGKYDVFISFRGEDTRASFVSHLYTALRQKQILTFVDNHLRRGEEISPSLLKAIEESKLSVIVFSTNYASSKWCLEELSKILECKTLNGQIVMPVFYKVDPSHVRNQIGSFADAFGRYELLIKEKALKVEKVQNWRAALNETANLSGWDSRNNGSEAEFIKEIVRDILNKLHKMSESQATSLAGIDARAMKIESLLRMESQDVRIVGIWGMGGIGKTTLARTVFDHIYNQFEGSYFLANAREKLKRHAAADLRDKLLSKILDKDCLLAHPLSSGNAFVRNWLRRERVLIVIDDVDNSNQLEELLPGQHDSFGPGSKILITSRDKQVLKNVVDEIYEVERLNHQESRQLFGLKAFKNYSPTIDQKDLFERMVSYAQGNPLALMVLGCALYGRSKEEWYSASNKLERSPNLDIQNVLRISYDGLDGDQRSIFLDIAYFFRRWDRNCVIEILDGSSVLFDISVLIDKSLLTVSRNKLEMHDLLREMACSIVREESKNPRKRSRLCDPEDIYHVLKKKKGTDAIEGICLDMSKSKEIHLECDAFAGMNQLRLLKFYDHFFSRENCKDKVHLPHGGLRYISDELRYFHWDGFPSKSLPRNFSAENLVELILPESSVEKLWAGVQDLVNLRSIDLSGSSHLIEIPNLSKAKNVESVDLGFCQSLVEIHPSIQYLDKLNFLNLRHCENLISLPSRIDSKYLISLSLVNCKNIRKCPQIPGNSMVLSMVRLESCSNIRTFPEISGNIEQLYLAGTSIEEIPSSIDFLTGLVELSMVDCKQLSSISSNIYKLKSLKILNLSRCSELRSLPEIIEPMLSLEVLDLGETAIKELPSPIAHLKSLKHLAINGTFVQEILELPSSLISLNASNCGLVETLLLCEDNILPELNFANCFKLDQNALIEDTKWKVQSGKIREELQIILPGSQIPQWFCHQSMGSSLTIQLHLNGHELCGIVFCIVLAPHQVISFPCQCHAKGNNGDVIFSSLCPELSSLKLDKSDHMVLWHDCIDKDLFSEYSGSEVKFEFYEQSEKIKHSKLKVCGIHLLFGENGSRNGLNPCHECGIVPLSPIRPPSAIQPEFTREKVSIQPEVPMFMELANQEEGIGEPEEAASEIAFNHEEMSFEQLMALLQKNQAEAGAIASSPSLSDDSSNSDSEHPGMEEEVQAAEMVVVDFLASGPEVLQNQTEIEKVKKALEYFGSLTVLNLIDRTRMGAIMELARNLDGLIVKAERANGVLGRYKRLKKMQINHKNKASSILTSIEHASQEKEKLAKALFDKEERLEVLKKQVAELQFEIAAEKKTLASFSSQVGHCVQKAMRFQDLAKMSKEDQDLEIHNVKKAKKELRQVSNHWLRLKTLFGS